MARYELSGPSEGPVVVLVPGLSVPYATWDRSAPLLAASGYRVLRYDHFGRGYSDRPRCAYDLGVFVDQLDELASALGLARPLVLVGLSMGGPVAVAAALRRPGLARALVLVDPLYAWPRPRGAARLLALPAIGELAMAAAGPRILAKGQRSDFTNEAAFEEFLPSYLPPFEFPGICRAVLRTVRSIPSWPLAETYESFGRLGLPTLVLWGRQDAVLPLAQGEAILASVPSARLRVVEDAGHVPQWEKPYETSRSIADFAAGLEG
jgi:pimeloyl-ACP methyl ester carboxylesterase